MSERTLSMDRQEIASFVESLRTSREAFIVETEGRPTAGDAREARRHPDTDLTGEVHVGTLDKRLQTVAQWSVPGAVVDDVGEVLGHLLLVDVQRTALLDNIPAEVQARELPPERGRHRDKSGRLQAHLLAHVPDKGEVSPWVQPTAEKPHQRAVARQDRGDEATSGMEGGHPQKRREEQNSRTVCTPPAKKTQRQSIAGYIASCTMMM